MPPALGRWGPSFAAWLLPAAGGREGPNYPASTAAPARVLTDTYWPPEPRSAEDRDRERWEPPGCSALAETTVSDPRAVAAVVADRADIPAAELAPGPRSSDRPIEQRTEWIGA